VGGCLPRVSARALVASPLQAQSRFLSLHTWQHTCEQAFLAGILGGMERLCGGRNVGSMEEAGGMRAFILYAEVPLSLQSLWDAVRLWRGGYTQ